MKSSEKRKASVKFEKRKHFSNRLHVPFIPQQKKKINKIELNLQLYTCPCISPQTVTGVLTGCIFDSVKKAKLHWVQ